MAKGKLKPCPFCGKKGTAIKHPYHKGKYVVHCGSKGYGCKFFPSSGPISKEELPDFIKAWNNRAGKD